MVFKMNYLTSDMNTETAWIAHKDNDLTSRDFIRKRQWLLMSISTDSHLDIHNDIIQEELGIKGRKRSLSMTTLPPTPRPSSQNPDFRGSVLSRTWDNPLLGCMATKS